MSRNPSNKTFIFQNPFVMTDSLKDVELVRPGLWAPPCRLDKVKRSLRAKIPKVSGREIDPVSFLYTNGFVKSAEFLEELVQSEPHLRTNKELVSRLSQGLMAVEELERNDSQLRQAIENFLKLIEWVSEKGHSRIAERIIVRTLEMCKDYKLDGGFFEAKTRFLQAKLLFNKNNLHEAAIEELLLAHNIGMGNNWLFDCPTSNSLLREINTLLVTCYHDLLESVRYSKPELAQDIAKKVLKHSLESENKSLISKSYLLSGITEMDTKNISKALKEFDHSISYAKGAEQPELLCEGLFQKALCLRRTGDLSRAESVAKQTREAAEEHELSTFVGKSLTLLGEIAVMQGKMEVATENFVAAGEMFSSLNRHELAIEARCSGAFSTSHQLIDSYIDLIRQSSNQTSLEKLRKWKELREPF